MKHRFFEMKMANREPCEIRERILFNSVFACLAYFAVATPAKIKATTFSKRARLKLSNFNMNKKNICLLILILAGNVFAQPQSSSEPTYGGLTLSKWLERLPSPPEEFPVTNEAIMAIKSIGTNALPYLIQMLDTDDTDTNNALPFRARDGIACLGDSAKPAIPQLVKLLQNPKRAMEVADSLRCLGREGFQALTNGFANTNDEVRFWSVSMLFSSEALTETNESVFQFQNNAKAAIPALITELQDSNPRIAHHAAFALESIHQEPELVIPALTRLLNDTNAATSPRKAAKKALLRYGVITDTIISTNRLEGGKLN